MHVWWTHCKWWHDVDISVHLFFHALTNAHKCTCSGAEWGCTTWPSIRRHLKHRVCWDCRQAKCCCQPLIYRKACRTWQRSPLSGRAGPVGAGRALPPNASIHLIQIFCHKSETDRWHVEVSQWIFVLSHSQYSVEQVWLPCPPARHHSHCLHMLCLV